MANNLSSPISILGLIMAGIGVMVAIVGIILLLVYKGKEKPWYIWFLICLGTVIGIVGGVMLAIGLSKKCSNGSLEIH